MKMPSMEWEPLSDWAARNGVSLEAAQERAFAYNEIEWSAVGPVVRHSPSEAKRKEWVKVSKSDQP